MNHVSQASAAHCSRFFVSCVRTSTFLSCCTYQVYIYCDPKVPVSLQSPVQSKLRHESPNWSLQTPAQIAFFHQNKLLWTNQIMSLVLFSRWPSISWLLNAVFLRVRPRCISRSVEPGPRNPSSTWWRQGATHYLALCRLAGGAIQQQMYKFRLRWISQTR